MPPVSPHPTRLFVSHISEEGDIAALLTKTVEEDFLGLVDFFASTDIHSIGAGADWLKAVEQAINEAAAVIVLCSKASVQRPWVQFELGAAWMKHVPIIPVCHSGMTVDELPMPLSRLHGVELSTPHGLERLYQTLAGLLKLGQAPQLRDLPGWLKRIEELERRFQQTAVQQFERYIDIVIPPPGKLDTDTIPDTAKIESNDVSMELFGLIGGAHWTWRDIGKAARKRVDTRWLGQLQRCVHSASLNEQFRPVQAIYHTERGSYQPQLARKECLPNGACRFHVHFVETVVAPLTDVQNDIGLLATLLRLGLRFRYEVLERSRKFANDVRTNRAKQQAAAESLLPILRGAIQIIENDALSRGAENIDREAVTALFDQESDRDEIFEIQESWDETRALLFKDDPSPTAQEVNEIIARMRDINFRFMRLATRRFHEMVCARWSQKPVKPAPHRQSSARLESRPG
jgi:hypothetical protein